MKNNLFKSLSFVLILIVSITAFAQVGIGTTDPHISSVLDIQSADSGVLIPRVGLTSTTTKLPIPNPIESLLVYNTNTVGDVIPGFYYWTGTLWKALTAGSGSGGGGSGWGLRGNVVGDDDFIGTLLNYKPLKFRIDNQYFGQFHPQGGISIGLNANANNDNGIAIGKNSISGTSNSVAIGSEASTSTSNLSVAIGPNSSVTNHLSIALGNTAVASGHSALSLGYGASAGGEGSTALGRSSSASAQYSTAIGYGATVGQVNTIRLGNDNAKIGIGTSTPHVSSIVEINATNKGLLIPRVSLTSTTDQATITQLTESLLVYNNNTAGDITPGFYYWTGSVWKALGATGGGSGGSSSKIYGEIYYGSDITFTMDQYTDKNAPNGVGNTLNSTGITTSADGLTLAANGGVYKVTINVTYSKATTSPVNTVEFFLTSWGNKVANTSVIGALPDDLTRQTVTLTKIISLANYQKYYFGIGKTGGATPNITIHKDMTNFIIERLD